MTDSKPATAQKSARIFQWWQGAHWTPWVNDSSGEDLRLKTTLWARMLTPIPGLGDPADGSRQEPGPEWLSVEGVSHRFGLGRRWLEDHCSELRRLGIVSKPSRKTTLFHARRLARFIAQRSQP